MIMSVNLEKGQDNQNEYYMIEEYYTSIMHEFCYFFLETLNQKQLRKVKIFSYRKQLTTILWI